MSAPAAPSTHHIVSDIWRHGLPTPAPLEALSFTGAEPGLPSSFRLGAAGQAAIAAAALAAAEVWRARTGRGQSVAVDMAHAMAEMRSERHFSVAGAETPDLWDPLNTVYATGDGGWLRMHTNFAHHRAGVVKILGCADTREAVADAMLGWRAEDFETEASARGLVVAKARTFAEWDAHPQAHALAALPLMEVRKIGEAPPTPLPGLGDRPLSGVRVLDLTRIIAGPVGGRTLAAHGAEVLLITAPHLPAVPGLVKDTGRGKRSARLDLRQSVDKDRLRDLAKDADVFLQGYRPGGLDDLGFSAEAMAAEKPGRIRADICAYGFDGPWAPKRGFDSLVQCATGFNLAEGEAAGTGGPKAFPCQALDHISGYLLAFGIMAALLRRAEEGGSWQVRVSLAQTALWLRGLGRLPDGLSAPDPGAAEVAPFLEATESGFGPLRAVRHSAVLSETPARWEQPCVPHGTHKAEW